RFSRDWSSDVCSSDLAEITKKAGAFFRPAGGHGGVGGFRLKQGGGGLPTGDGLSNQADLGKGAIGELVEAESGFGNDVGKDGPRSEERRVGKEWWSRW